MSKNKKQIDLTEVLDELKASVIALYPYENKKISATSKKVIAAISTHKILTAFGELHYFEWLRLCGRFKVTSHRDYLKWLEKEFTRHELKGELKKHLLSLSANVRTDQKVFVNLWTRLHRIFYDQLDEASLKLIDVAYEKQHYIEKANSLPYSEPESTTIKEEVRFELYDYVQKKTSGVATFSDALETQRHLMYSSISPLKWIAMLTDLSHSGYLSPAYAENDSHIKKWLATAIHFSNSPVHVNLPVSIEKLNWIGPATAFAEWVLQLKQRVFANAKGDNTMLLKWIVQTIDYPGTYRSLHSALADSPNYAKCFSCEGVGVTFSFKVKVRARVSRKRTVRNKSES